MGHFTMDDLVENEVELAPNLLPGFIQDFGKKLSSKRGANKNVRHDFSFCQRFLTEELQDLPTIRRIGNISKTYFDTSPQKTVHIADTTEVFHLASLDVTIKRVFKKLDGSRKPVEELNVNWIFFYQMTPYFESKSDAAIKLYESTCLYCSCELTSVIRGADPWPFHLIV